MTNSRALISKIVLAICLLGDSSQGFAETVRIIVYDNAKLGEKMVSAAENVTGRILSTAGVEAEWGSVAASEPSRPAARFSSVNSDTAPVDRKTIRIQVLPCAPRRFPPGALGFSLPNAMAGMQIAIFADRVAAVSYKQPPTAARVLGYAMAHELGHVLLRSSAHDDSGMMKGVWGNREWQRAAAEIIPFTSEQKGKILAHLRDELIAHGPKDRELLVATVRTQR